LDTSEHSRLAVQCTEQTACGIRWIAAILAFAEMRDERKYFLL
jgi:hypothetical protein